MYMYAAACSFRSKLGDLSKITSKICVCSDWRSHVDHLRNPQLDVSEALLKIEGSLRVNRALFGAKTHRNRET